MGTSKALQEFSVEKQKAANDMKEKIRQDYARKVRQIETKAAIARSTATNKARLEKIRARQEVMAKLGEDAKNALLQELKNDAKHKEFITKLIAQGMLMLLEDEVQVRCRACDEGIVKACLDAAQKECKLSMDTEIKLPPAPDGVWKGLGTSCLGGVVLACQKGTITIDNTIDSRLALVMEQAKPTIRKTLFS